MRRTCFTLMLGACFGALGMWASVSWKDLAAHAEADSMDGAGTPTGNGDVNGDGVVDMSDAVYTLMWLFSGGPAPKVLECGGTLAATGQTMCYDTDGFRIDCGRITDWQGQDGFYQAGCSTAGRFTSNGNGTVTDHCTGLMWQKDTPAGTYTWQNALKYCETLNLAGHGDWRLPNVRELGSIVDYGRERPSIDPIFRAESYYYWSSSTAAGYTGDAWNVHFGHGSGGTVSKADFNGYVRAVRSGP